MSVSMNQMGHGVYIAPVGVLKALVDQIFADRTLVDLKELARALPGRPHISTVYRWTNPGLNGVRLETVKFGGRRFTTRELVLRFAASLSNPSRAS
jgi:Protein of unknown function (DUF1580)